MSDPITVLASMAPKAVLADLAQAYQTRSGRRVAARALGGVEVKRRVLAGESHDVIVLAQEGIAALAAAGHLLPSPTDIACSSVAVAVRTGALRPAIDSEAALMRAVLAAESIGCSTGPSGAGLFALFERWGIAERVSRRLVMAPPGVPVAALIASGDVTLGFQQLSELIHVPGVDVLGVLPAPVQIVTTFSAGVGARSRQPGVARALIDFLASPSSADVKRRLGMAPAQSPTARPQVATS